MLMDPSRRVDWSQAEPMREYCLQSGPHHLADERRGSIVAAAGASFLGLHDALEYPSEHVRSDEFSGVVLADGEVKTLKQIVEGGAPIAVPPDRGAESALEGGRLEETAVEEGDLPERSGRGSTPISGPIQCTEAECVQEGPVEVTTRGQRAIEQSWYVARVAIEPALRLDEIEEEHAGECRQRERVTIHFRSRRVQAIGEPIQRRAECPEETGCNALAREDFRDAQREGERRFTLDRRESLQYRQTRGPRLRQGDRREPQSHRGGSTHQTQRLTAQRTRQPAFRAGREPPSCRSPRLLRIGRRQRKHAKRATPRDQ